VKRRIALLAALVAFGVVGVSTPAFAGSDWEFGSHGCNYGYDVVIHSNGTNTVTHTMRQSGTSANNKAKTWSNGPFGQPRGWGYGYQTVSFSEAYTSSWFWTDSGQYLSCN
jgi:hypothetical protein